MVLFLDASDCRFVKFGGVLRLTLDGDRSWVKVDVVRAFPISDAAHYIGLLDGAGKDIGVIQNPELLDTESKELLDEELQLRYFVPIVERVLGVKEEFGSIYWDVVTDRGEAKLIVRNIRDNLHEVSPGRVMITDVDGNRFEFRNIERLDAKSQDIFIRNT